MTHPHSPPPPCQDKRDHPTRGRTPPAPDHDDRGPGPRTDDPSLRAAARTLMRETDLARDPAHSVRRGSPMDIQSAGRDRPLRCRGPDGSHDSHRSIGDSGGHSRPWMTLPRPLSTTPPACGHMLSADTRLERAGPVPWDGLPSDEPLHPERVALPVSLDGVMVRMCARGHQFNDDGILVIPMHIFAASTRLGRRGKFLDTLGKRHGMFCSIVLDGLGIGLIRINRHYDVCVIRVLGASRCLNLATDAGHVSGPEYIPPPKCRIHSGCVPYCQPDQFTGLGMIHSIDRKFVTIFRRPKCTPWNIERLIRHLIILLAVVPDHSCRPGSSMLSVLWGTFFGARPATI